MSPITPKIPRSSFSTAASFRKCWRTARTPEEAQAPPPSRDPLRERFGAGPRIGVLGYAHHQVGLGALDFLLRKPVPFARRGQQGVFLLPARPGRGKPLAPPGGLPLRLRA